MKEHIRKYKELPVQVKASFWFLICSFTQKAISVITTPIFTRLMSTSEYGEFNVFISWMNIIMVVVSLDLFYEVFEQGVVKFSEKRSMFCSSMQGLEVTLICCWGVIYGIFHERWNRLFSLNTVQMVMMFLIIWTTAVYNFWAVEQRVKYQYKNLAMLTIATSLIIPICGIGLVMISKYKATARIISIAVIQILAYSGLFIVQGKRGKKLCDKFFWKYALSMNIALLPHYLSQTVLNSADRIMIDKITGKSGVGIYSLAYSIALVMTMFNQTLNQTLGPWYFSKIKEKKIKDIGRAVYPSYILIAVVNLMLIAFAPEIVKIFAPSDYYDAVWIIPPITMSVYFTFSYDVFCKFEFYYEKSKTITAITLIGAVLNIILNYIFIRQYGYQAAAYTTLICYIIYAGLHFISMNCICKKEFDGEKPFKAKILLLITCIFMLMAIAFQISYKYIVLRGCLIVGIIFIILVFRKKIKDEIKLVYLLKK